MIVTGVDHVAVRTRDLAGTIAFYDAVLGLKDGPRPPFDFPGAWLYAGDRPVIHVYDVAASAPDALASAPPIDHIAFAAEGFDAFCAKLEALGVAFRAMNRPERPSAQIFLTDPNDLRVELNFRRRGAQTSDSAVVVEDLNADQD